MVLDHVLDALAAREFGGRLGVDTEGLNVLAWAALSERLTAAGIEPVLVEDVFVKARRVKSAWEIENLRAAHDITQNALLACRDMIEVGVTATALRREFIRQCWNDPRTTEIRFANISVGPSWSPIYYPDRTEPARVGDLVAFDAGAEVRGYGADIARAWPVGGPLNRAEEVHRALEEGHRELRGALVPGAKLSDVFEHTMSVVRGHGLSEYRRGHVGHSVGLSKAIEEWPQIAPGTTQTAQEGMVFCLETPYYGFGIGAMNVEDMVVVGATEAENWTSLPSWGADA